MKCPACYASQTQVIDSRISGDGFAIRRRRKCSRCRLRFSTYEEIELLNFYVVKKDGRRELYDKNKLVNGLRKACQKRPIPIEQFDKLVNRIEREIRKSRKKEISSKVIGEIAMKELKKIDEVAYIRFASVYRSFKDIESFQAELKSLIK